MKNRPYYLTTADGKRVKGKRYSIDSNAIWEARSLCQAAGKTICVMRDGVLIREVLPKSRRELLLEEIAVTERKLERLYHERDKSNSE